MKLELNHTDVQHRSTSLRTIPLSQWDQQWLMLNKLYVIVAAHLTSSATARSGSPRLGSRLPGQDTLRIITRAVFMPFYGAVIVPHAWFPPFRWHVAIAVSPFPLLKFCKNPISAVRITLYTIYVKNSVVLLPFQLPFCCNRQDFIMSNIKSFLLQVFIYGSVTPFLIIAI